ncbi:hypothetical protein [Vibrio diabolicus]|uniref:hypothetical protein n=1 Tax=Vibrio diabolicus TaxID=50719 RepID=UPI003D7EA186
MNHRREFLITILNIASVLSLGHICKSWAWPKGDEEECYLKVGGCNTSSPINSSFGCSLSASAASSLTQMQLLESCGDRRIDFLINQESRVLADITGFQPGFAFLNDNGSPNAFATPQQLLGYADGSVLFGVNLVHKEIRSLGPLWDAAVVFIMAHEWGHIAEYQNGLRENAKEMELLSDYIGGWYLGMKLSSGMRFDPRGAAKSVFEKGDFNFNDPSHHGTPSERLAATEAGFSLGNLYRERNFRKAFESGRMEVGI